MGDVGIFSLQQGQNITSIAGGISLTRNPVLAKAMAATRTPTSPHTSWGHRPSHRFAEWQKRWPFGACVIRPCIEYPFPCPGFKLGRLSMNRIIPGPTFRLFRLAALFSLEQLEAITAARTQRAVVYQQHFAGAIRYASYSCPGKGGAGIPAFSPLCLAATHPKGGATQS